MTRRFNDPTAIGPLAGRRGRAKYHERSILTSAPPRLERPAGGGALVRIIRAHRSVRSGGTLLGPQAVPKVRAVEHERYEPEIRCRACSRGGHQAGTLPVLG